MPAFSSGSSWNWIAAAGSVLNPAIYVNDDRNGENFEPFLHCGFTTVDDNNLQSLQTAGKHPPFGISQSRQVLRTSFAKDTGSKFDEVATLIHGTNRGVAV